MNGTTKRKDTFNWQKDAEEKKQFLKDNLLKLTDEEMAAEINRRWPEDGRATRGSVVKQRPRWGLLKPLGGIQNSVSSIAETDDDIRKFDEQLKKENRRLALELEKRDFITERILEVVRSSIIKLPAYKPRFFQRRKKLFDPEDMAWAYSDSQIGQKVTLNDSSGFAEYNFDIFKEEINKLEEAIIKIKNIHSQAYNIEKFWVLGLGDYIEGELVYAGQTNYIDQIVVDQVFKGAKLIAGLIRNLSMIFPKVEVVLVSGQHGRGPKEMHWRSNWDYVFSRLLQDYLENVENCKVVVAESALCGLDIRGHVFLLNHGNEIRSWNTIPFYGLERAALRWVNLTRLPVEYVLIGDKHRRCTFDIAYIEAMVNGSWSPGSKFSVDKMQAAGVPKQILFGIHDIIGKSFSYDIRLAEPAKLEKDEDGFYTPVR